MINTGSLRFWLIRCVYHHVPAVNLIIGTVPWFLVQSCALSLISLSLLSFTKRWRKTKGMTGREKLDTRLNKKPRNILPVMCCLVMGGDNQSSFTSEAERERYDWFPPKTTRAITQPQLWLSLPRSLSFIRDRGKARATCGWVRTRQDSVLALTRRLPFLCSYAFPYSLWERETKKGKESKGKPPRAKWNAILGPLSLLLDWRDTNRPMTRYVSLRSRCV